MTALDRRGTAGTTGGDDGTALERLVSDVRTAPYALAITRAEVATKRLNEIVADRIGGIGSLESVVRTAGSRVCGEWKAYRPSEQQIKWAMGKQRG